MHTLMRYIYETDAGTRIEIYMHIYSIRKRENGRDMGKKY